VSLSGAEDFQHRSCRYSANNYDDQRSVDVGVLHDYLQAIDNPSLILHQGRALPGELPQLPLRLRGESRPR